MRLPITKDVDLPTLAVRLKTVLGRDVALSGRKPGQVDANGEALPGVVVVLDAVTGEPLDLPAGPVAAVQGAVDAHSPPPKAKSPAEHLTDALKTAATVEELRAVLVGYAEALVGRERRARERPARPGRGGRK